MRDTEINALMPEVVFEFGRIAIEPTPTYYKYHCEFRHDCLNYAVDLINYWQNIGLKSEDIEDIDLWVMFYCDKYRIIMHDKFVCEFQERKNEIDFNNLDL